jgi:hypothetical protein
MKNTISEWKGNLPQPDDILSPGMPDTGPLDSGNFPPVLLV